MTILNPISHIERGGVLYFKDADCISQRQLFPMLGQAVLFMISVINLHFSEMEDAGSES